MNTFYADGFSMTGSLTDAKFDFMVSEPAVNEQGIVVGERQIIGERVIMSLPLAKEFAGKLSELIAAHEKQFGEVASLSKMKEMLENNEQQ